MHAWLRNARECDRTARAVKCEVTRKALLRCAGLWREMADDLARFRHRALMDRLRRIRRDSRGRFTTQKGAQ